MINRLIYPLFFFALIASCKGHKKRDYVEVEREYKPSLFHFAYLFSPHENNLSFPLWFNDSLLKIHSIRKIVRKTYVFDVSESVDLLRPSALALSDRKEYVVDRNGRMEKLRFAYFYEGEKIGSLRFHYRPNSEVKGFCYPTNSDTSSITELSGSNSELPIKIHQALGLNRKYLSFQNTADNNKIFFLINPAYWGPISVDSILHPRPEDQIVLGSPKKPFKSYNVRNKILEKDVMYFNYIQGTRLVKKLTWVDFPFATIRTFQFDKRGMCKGFIDSLYSGNDFLKRTIATIWCNKKNLPVKVLFKHEVKPGEQRIGRLEVFRYFDAHE